MKPDTSKVNSSLNEPVEVSFAISTAEDGVNGYVRKGDLVNILYTKTNKETNMPETYTLLENAYILESYDENYQAIDVQDETTKAMYFKICVEKNDVNQFTAVISENKISVVKLTSTTEDTKTSGINTSEKTDDISAGESVITTETSVETEDTTENNTTEKSSESDKEDDTTEAADK